MKIAAQYVERLGGNRALHCCSALVYILIVGSRVAAAPPSGGSLVPEGAGAGDTLIYSNTGGSFVYRPGRGVAIADDLATVAIESCLLSAYTIRVSGGGDGTGPGFRVSTALFDRCPGRGGQMIARTDRIVALPNDGVFDILVDVSHVPVALPPVPWVQARFNSSAAGWVVGSPTELGFSADAYYHPRGGCLSWFGGYPRFPHASFHVQVYALGDCPTEFPAYRAHDVVGPTSPEGQDILVAEDITLDVNECDLASYELGIRADVGPYEMRIDLRQAPGPGDPIPGTLRSYRGRGDDTLEIARFSFEPGISLPRQFWVTWRPDTAGVGAVIAGAAEIGHSEDLYAVFNHPNGPPGWSYHSFGGDPPAVYYLSIKCRGDPPTGACCASEGPGEVSQCFDGVVRRDCAGVWIEDATCIDAPFSPPCGAHACCLPPDACADLVESDCVVQGGFWRAGESCQEDGQPCPPFGCLGATGDCFSVDDDIPCGSDAECPSGRLCQNDGICEPRVGCCIAGCCEAVCGDDPYCCSTAWDHLCVQMAQAADDLAVPNDECWSPIPLQGALEVALTADGQGAVDADNRHACRSAEDPGFCCHALAPDGPGFGPLWFKFQAAHSSARVHTCATAAGTTATDSLVQVFGVSDPTDDQTSCHTLETVACNDDGGCGPSGRLSDLCVAGLVPGEMYYILLASRSPLTQGGYRLSIESPCPHPPQGTCPEGAVTWLDPPPGVIDARQPYCIDDPTISQGINQVLVRAPETEASCWAVTMTGNTGEPNGIADVSEHVDGTYILSLEQPLGPGRRMMVTYTSDSACSRATASFVALPADADGSGISTAEDISTVVDCCLNRLCVPVFGTYSCDIDHSGRSGPQDVLRLLDLLNGAGPYDVWLGETLPARVEVP